VTFSGISATGKGDLVLVVSGAGTPSGDDVRILLNGDTAGNYYNVYAYGIGSGSGGSSSNAGTNRIDIFGAWSSNFDNLFVAQFSDFSATDKQKSVLIRTNGVTSSRVAMSAARWANTSAITSMEIKFPSYAFQAATTFHLYQLVSE
jgi:hypothetical protein